MNKRKSIASFISYQHTDESPQLYTQRKTDSETEYPFDEGSLPQHSIPQHSILKDAEIKRLKQIVSRQDFLIKQLLGECSMPAPDRLVVTNFVENQAADRKKGRRQHLLLREFIDLLQTSQFVEGAEMMAEIERLRLDFEAKQYGNHNFQSCNKQLQQSSVQLETLRKQINQSQSILKSYQANNKKLQDLVKNQKACIDLLLREIPVMHVDGSRKVQKLVESLNEVFDGMSRRRRHKSSVMLGAERSVQGDWGQSRDGCEEPDTLRARLSAARKRIKYLERQNKEVNQILDGLIPMLKKESK